MISRKLIWIASSAALVLLGTSSVIAQFGGLGDLTKAMDSLSKAVQPSQAPTTPETPQKNQSSEQIASVPPAKPRDILKGQWVPVEESCTPKGMISDSYIEFGVHQEIGTPFSNEEYMAGPRDVCTFPKVGVINQSSYSGKMMCGYEEGYEGEPQIEIDVNYEGILYYKRPKFQVSQGDELSTYYEDAKSGHYKRCSGKLSGPPHIGSDTEY